MSEQKTVVEEQVQEPVENAKKQKPKKKNLVEKISPLLWATVVIPTLASVVYFGVIASDQYTSESTFVVRSSKSQSSFSGLGALLQNVGFSRAQDDTYTVRDYMYSRTALAELGKALPVRTFYEEKGDIFSRFNALGLFGSKEAFYQYYKDKIQINFDAVSGISLLEVTSFDAQESKQINAALLKQGEHLINKLNERARQDTIRYAEDAVKVAEQRVKETAANMTNYRTNNKVFDLKAQSEVQMGLVSKLQDELIVIQTQLDQVKAITPDNPQLQGLKAREQSLRKEIAQQTKMISGGGSKSLTGQAEEYQRLFLENDLATKQLAAAITSLESAKAEANRQQLYLEVVSQPSEPDLATKPHRFYNIVATFIIGLMMYGILSLLIASVREHKN
ncbi:capsule polysaccharide transporter [Neisseria wadsworthii]|uniref:Capsule polysaccharide export inner-membrane protein CtrB n=1 Tax=Neisseria wadsworthii 9715 TaxID=1030841 RepID=G4CM12_9NEIS|nr:capsule polysaccharide transporter [Neisseria wadsworthii]EGZ51259.1 capsule polysaccharide export inner-membrane protein CtrB [Neisseria wadsworthii 9715]QMT36184.1 capsule biosynthesis protein [Neisseria wadsworthii]